MAAQQEHVVAGAAAEEQQTEHQQIYQQDVYESDEEFEEPLPLALRRREASDDEEEDSDGRDRVHHHHLMHQGGHETEDDEGAPPLEDEDDDDEEENDVRVGLGDGGGVEEYVVDDEEYEEEEDLDEAGENGGARVLDEQGGDKDGDGDDKVKDEVKEPKKEPEPFSVPTAGAFYMHDDRFRDNGNARPRRMSGGRKLWEAKDDRNWVHDRFEELNLQDEERQGRRGRGFYRGRGRGRGRGGGRVQERSNRSRMYSDMTAPTYVRRGGGGGRGRGGRQQEVAVRRSEDVTDRPRKQAPKPMDSIPSNNFNKKNYTSGSVYQDGGNPRRNIVSSSLNSASPPFYPSGAQQDISATVKKGQRGIAAGNASHSVLKVDEQISSPNASSVGNGRNIVSTRGQPQVYAEQSQRTFEKKPMNTPNTNSSSNSTHQHTHTRRNTGPVGQAAGGQQAIRNTNHSQAEPVQQRVAQNQGQGSQRATSQSVAQQATSINQSLSRADSSEDREGTSPPASNNAKSVQRARGNSQVVVRGSYGYNGGQAIVSTSGMPLGDQNFTHTPALLPVMPLGGQHPGLGVPAVGMALPGYVAQPQMGFGNSDMTWVPLFAGAAGALGATYCSPYIAMDGNYYPQPAGQLATPSTAGRDSNSNKPQSSWKSPSRSDMGNDEFGQRQNKPRRYSEMNFGQ